MSKKFDNVEINKLIRRIKKGDEQAATAFFKIFKVYIEGIVRKYSKKTNIKNDADLRSYIRIGFYKAALQFNENKDTQFKNYAYFWVKKLIFSEEQKFRIIKLPINQKLFYDTIIDKFNLANGMYNTDITDEEIHKIELINNTEVSTFSSYGYNEASTSMSSSYSVEFSICKLSKENTEKNDVDIDNDKEKIRYNINVMLANFSSLEKEIIEYTYGLNDRPELHTHALATKLNMSDSTLLSKKNKLIRLMRHSSLTEHLFK